MAAYDQLQVERTYAATERAESLQTTAQPLVTTTQHNSQSDNAAWEKFRRVWLSMFGPNVEVVTCSRGTLTCRQKTATPPATDRTTLQPIQPAVVQKPPEDPARLNMNDAVTFRKAPYSRETTTVLVDDIANVVQSREGWNDATVVMRSGQRFPTCEPKVVREAMRKTPPPTPPPAGGYVGCASSSCPQHHGSIGSRPAGCRSDRRALARQNQNGMTDTPGVCGCTSQAAAGRGCLS